MIRETEIGDIEAVAQIYGEAVMTGTASFETEAPGIEGMTERFLVLKEKGYPYYSAVVDDRVVGFSFAGPYRARQAYNNTVENAIYVDPAYHGRGIARLLMERLIESCTAKGFRQMVAVVGDSRNSGSINLHRSLGFHITGTLHSVGYKHGRWLDVLFMQRALGDGDHSAPG